MAPSAGKISLILLIPVVVIALMVVSTGVLYVWASSLPNPFILIMIEALLELGTTQMIQSLSILEPYWNQQRPFLNGVF